MIFSSRPPRTEWDVGVNFYFWDEDGDSPGVAVFEACLIELPSGLFWTSASAQIPSHMVALNQFTYFPLKHLLHQTHGPSVT
jgi:hypothetical protein